jgi:hypothetical protein
VGHIKWVLPSQPICLRTYESEIELITTYLRGQIPYYLDQFIVGMFIEIWVMITSVPGALVKDTKKATFALIITLFIHYKH